MSKVYIKSFGCQMNEYDANKLVGILERDLNFDRSEEPQDANLILLNTCSIREKAQEKLFDELGRLRKFKVSNPKVKIGVGGCVASQEGSRILNRAPYVDFVFGPQTIHRLPDMIKRNSDSGQPQVDISFPLIEKFDSLPPSKREGPKAFVSIMEGCSKYCSFCVVPYTRGQEVSRPVIDILDEIADLALIGVKEVTLLGQNVNAYLGVDPKGNMVSFAQLLECVALIEGIIRIRYTTSHPVNFTDDLIQAHATNKKLMPWVHLPVQSGDDRMLSAMKRGHTLLEYKQIIRKLRDLNLNLSITSDFIVGFPGESEKQFEQTLKLISWVNYDGGYSFIYSPRPGTPAANLTNTIDKATQTARLEKLQKLLFSQAHQYNLKHLNTTNEVLVEGPAKKGDYLQGRLPDNRLVVFSGEAKIGEIINVEINSLRGTTLVGRIID